MKQILIAIACSGLLSAQNFVFIPDTAFLSFLKTLTPAAVSGHSLDITHTLVTQSTKTMIIVSCPASNLSGIENFKALDKLNLNYCYNLLSLPKFPPSLKVLDIFYSKAPVMPDLPASMRILRLTSCSITSLPTLNDSLKELTSTDNAISFGVLPSGLTTFGCTRSQLSSLPVLPASLEKLWCGENQLATFTTLPASLELLSCPQNLFVTLPALPPTLKHLNCAQNNSLTILPQLPVTLETLTYNDCPVGNMTQMLPNLRQLNCSNTSAKVLQFQSQLLENLDCSNNQIENLPALPPTLRSFLCQNNKLTDLPFLPPRLRNLNCENNMLTGLPDLPDTLTAFFCGGNYISCFREIPIYIQPPASFKYGPFYIGLLPNPFKCLPNYVNYYGTMPPDYLLIPLCTSQEKENCNLTTSVEESVYNIIGIYPNPARDLLKINTNGEPIQFITIVDATGRTIFQCNSCENMITTSEYHDGVYLLQALIGNKQYSARFAVAH